MASSNQTPDVLFSPIAANADTSDINTIPQTYDPANYGYAAQNVGFPTECRLPVLNPDGTLGQGRAPRMQDWNGIMKLVSSHNFFLQNGGSYTFNPTVSSNIGGYPKNAVLWYFPENEAPCLVYSLINDNTNNFVDDPTLIDGSHWEMLVNPSSYANIALTNSPYTTNRILEIPQDIKLELNNGTLTLKAGSKVYVPNGFEQDGTTPKFDVVNVPSDLIISYSNSTPYDSIMICLRYDGTKSTYFKDIIYCLSGTSPTTYSYYYNTSTNELYDYESSSSSPTEKLSFPLGIFKWGGASGVTEIKQIFNGFGYIGSTVFALPRVKVQTPNGRNADGTYKSVIRTIDSVRTFNAGAWGTRNLNIQISGVFEGQAVESFTYNKKFSSDTTTYSYDENTGIWWYSSDQSSWAAFSNNVVGSCQVENGKVTQFQVGTVDSVANSNASNFSQAGRSYLSGLGYPSDRYIDLTLGASGSSYTAPANGYFLVYVYSGNTYTYSRIRNMTTGFERLSPSYGTSSNISISDYPAHKGEVVRIDYTAQNVNFLRFYYAEGEN